MQLLSFDATAELLAIPKSTLRHWVAINYGPPSIRIGKRRVFRQEDVHAWIEEQFQEQAKPHSDDVA